MLAILNRQGDLVIGCQLRGTITVVDVASRKILDIVRVSPEQYPGWGAFAVARTVAKGDTK